MAQQLAAGYSSLCSRVTLSPSRTAVTERSTASAGTLFARVVKEWNAFAPGATLANDLAP
ncbi:hypothetical protein [Rathayibacter oskolensis]|uniref:hypothetical protein n=1 Tax=Rathayibacter oskolensis TaxID=1891671 RepID=UPI003466E60B